jgi:hypothetical protein
MPLPAVAGDTSFEPAHFCMISPQAAAMVAGSLLQLWRLFGLRNRQKREQ